MADYLGRLGNGHNVVGTVVVEARSMYRAAGPPVFLQVLEHAALAAGANIRKGVTVATIEDEANASLVTFKNGEQQRYDLVVGADGIGSHTRALLFPDAPKPASRVSRWPSFSAPPPRRPPWTSAR